MKTLSRLLGCLRPYLAAFIGACVAAAVFAAAQAAPAALMKVLVDDVLIPTAEPDLLIWFLAVLLIASVVKGYAGYLSSYLMAWVGQSVVMDLRDRTYDAILFQSLDFFHRNPTGHLISRLTYDVSLVQAAVSTHLRDLIQGGLTIMGLVVFLFWLDWRLALIGLVILPPVAVALQKFARRLRRTSRRSQEQMAAISTQVHESGAGIRIVKAFQGEERERARFRSASKALRDVHLKAYQIQALTSPLMEVFGILAASALIAYAFFRISDGTMTAGDFMSFLTAMFLMYSPLKRISSANNAVQQALIAAERVFEILDEEPTVRDVPGAVELPPLRESIRFEGVGFAYRDEAVLREIDLDVRAGEVVAVVGESGAGKSTLVSLLPRFYDPDRGRILFDGAEIRQATCESLRRQIAVVTQETVLFNDTILTNIRYGRPDAEHEAVEHAARAANAHDFIQELPEGYDTPVGELGGQLSGGQRQRIAIARALLKDPPLLILDEPTSNLDSRSETLVQEALARLMSGRTVFLIAHRLSTVQQADRIVVMDRGRIVEVGSHQVLLERDGHYARLHEMQFAGV